MREGIGKGSSGNSITSAQSEKEEGGQGCQYGGPYLICGPSCRGAQGEKDEAFKDGLHHSWIEGGCED